VEDLIDFIARALVERPDDVEVRRVDEENLELLVAPDDLGKVIGRKGRTAKAMRALLRAMADEDERVGLEIVAHEAEQAAE
jgi:predicted RNA-binding protein YlqC (UPF0109 family)